MSDAADAAQEFAERVAEKWNSEVGGGMDGLVSTIATELRAGGWVKGRAEPPMVSSEDLMSGIQ